MVQFKYNNVMKRYDVKVPFTLADESDMVVVASITEDEESRVVLHRDLSLKLLKQIILHWDEYEHQMERKSNELIEIKPKKKKLTHLQERLQIPGRRERTDAWKGVSVDEMELSTRPANCLQWKGIRTIGELVEQKASDLLKFKMFGRKSLFEIMGKLGELDLALKQ